MITGPVRGTLEGWGDKSKKLYFFRGAQYWRYDLEKDYGEVDYPQPLSAWRLPAEFGAGVDACLSGRGPYAGKSYFFKDGWYAHYDSKTNVVTERRSLARWDRDHAFPFPGGIDAALNGQGTFEGKAYFFKGDKYARYDWKTDRIDLVDQKLSAWRLGDGFDSNITACAKGEDGKNPTAYFFKGEQYVKYDWTENRVRAGYPMLIVAGWPSGCAVWASHSQAPTNVCGDPRLDEGKARAAYPWGSLRGQAGWQARLRFTNVKELADKSSALTIPKYYGDDKAGEAVVPPRRITRLGINGHAFGGGFGINGPNAKSEIAQSVTDMRVLAPKDGNELRANLQRINEMLAPGAPILLLGCEAAQTNTGGILLMTLSSVFKDHPVTGFTSVGAAGGPRTKREGQDCSEAGMRDTSFLHTSRSSNEENERLAKYWGNLDEWPWASEFSPRAKTALNNEIIRRPETDLQ